MEKANEQTLRDRLNQAEKALERSERLAVASRYAGAIMHEVNNPVEAITNLVYLTKLQNVPTLHCKGFSHMGGYSSGLREVM